MPTEVTLPVGTDSYFTDGNPPVCVNWYRENKVGAGFPTSTYFPPRSAITLVGKVPVLKVCTDCMAGMFTVVTPGSAVFPAIRKLPVESNASMLMFVNAALEGALRPPVESIV